MNATYHQIASPTRLRMCSTTRRISANPAADERGDADLDDARRADTARRRTRHVGQVDERRAPCADVGAARSRDRRAESLDLATRSMSTVDGSRLGRCRRELDDRDHCDEHDVHDDDERERRSTTPNAARRDRASRPAPRRARRRPRARCTPARRGAAPGCARAGARSHRSLGRRAHVAARRTIRRARKLTANVRRNSASPAAIEAAALERRRLAEVDRDVRRDRRRAALQDVRVRLCQRRRDHDRDRDRLAERPPEAEQRAADDPAARERQDHVADHSPPGAAERERALALLARHLRHDVAR